MAAPDIQNLFERFLQIYGRQGGSAEASRPEPRYQSSQPTYSALGDAYGSEDGYAPMGGVLRGLNSSSSSMPWRAQTLARPGGVAVGLRGPQPVGRIGGLPFPPSGPTDVVEIPNPHLERFVPQSTRDIWNAATLIPQMFRGQWRGEEPSGNTEGRDGASSTNPSPEPPTNRPGRQPPWLFGPVVLKEELERQGKTSNQSQQPKVIVDPNFRRLTRFLGSEGDQIVSDNSVRPTGEEKPSKPPVIPLPDHHLDIPEFLLRQPEPEPAKPDEKLTVLPSVSVGGGGNYGRNPGGGGGGGRKSDEQCRKEWERAHEICVDAFVNGTIGDIIKRWKSDYATGPFPKPNNEPWDVNDCKPGFVSEDCGGKEYERAPPPEETKVIGRRLVQQKKEARAKKKAKENEILEEFNRTGKWRFRG